MKPAARRRARECAVQALYSWQLSQNDIADVEYQFLAEQDVKDVDVLYFRELLSGVHAAVRLASTVGTLLVWVGEAGVRVYSSGQPGGARADKLLYQAKLALDDDLRLKVVRKMYELRFREPPPARRAVEQLRGIEGSVCGRPMHCWRSSMA
ncbi:hypothetical protein RB531_2 [Salmonella enterica subsp. enterica serovar Typhimurium]